jgi:L-fuconolactonase
VRIDAHQHFWRYSPADYPWIGPSMGRLARDYLPPDLAPELAAADLDGCIAVQARSTVAETEFLLALAEGHEIVKAVVGWADLAAPDAAAVAARLAKNPKLRGLRHIVQDEPEDAFLRGEAFRRGVAALGELGLVYDVLIYPKHLPYAAEFCAALPHVTFVLDHLAKPFIGKAEREPWATQFRSLAELPNVSCKISGLVTEAKWNAWRDEDFAFYLDTALDAYGPERLLYGSDWPVCLLGANDYGQTHGLVRRWAAKLSTRDRDGLFGRNAARIYRLS